MRRMKKIWEKIQRTSKRTAERVMHIWSLIFLTLAYFTIFGITAMMLKILGKRQLVPFQRSQNTYWIPRPRMKHTLDEMKRQF